MPIFALLIFAHSIVSGNAHQSKCEINQDQNYLKTKTFENSCYFVDKRKINEANMRLPLTEQYRFNIATARRICQNESATLPIITNFAENQFLAKQFEWGEEEQNVLGIALGLTQVQRS